MYSQVPKRRRGNTFRNEKEIGTEFRIAKASGIVTGDRVTELSERVPRRLSTTAVSQIVIIATETSQLRA